jgi:hypothetical protein
MNRKYSAIAMSALVMGAAAVSATDAAAMLKDPGRGYAPAPATADGWPDEGSGYPTADASTADASTTACNFANHPVCKATPVEAAVPLGPSADTGFGSVELGASALGGAAVAFGGMWLYRRRQLQAG